MRTCTQHLDVMLPRVYGHHSKRSSPQLSCTILETSPQKMMVLKGNISNMAFYTRLE